MSNCAHFHPNPFYELHLEINLRSTNDLSHININQSYATQCWPNNPGHESSFKNLLWVFCQKNL